MGPVDEVFSKGAYGAAYSGFEGVATDGTALAAWLQSRELNDADVVGIATDYCVAATAHDAVHGGLHTRVLTAYSVGISEESVNRALDELQRAGVEVIR
ncbi:Putative nicotinamidase/pyrazinamidase [Mycobacteroides abscessus subsp. abscessus]|nr:isochorismatase family protein [Mycobacteroides abscessus MAB_082312_2258]SIK32438.1 Putative nicotinamidase/pyrazinamidase [Mycobacteroides abscessus subsp. abscessus]